MRKIKILVSVLISVALLLSLFVPAMAAEEYKITIENPVHGQKYYVYKVFDLQYTVDAYNKPVGGIYTASNDLKVFIENHNFTGITFGSQLADGKWEVKPFSEETAKLFAAFLKGQEASFSTAGITVVGDGIADPTAGLTVSTPGYYFVTSTAGSLCSLDSTTPNAVIQEKNTAVTVDKCIVDDGEYISNTAQIGDTVNFKITVKIPVGSLNVRLHDIMEDGLTLDKDSFEVKVNNTELDDIYYVIGIYDNPPFDMCEDCTFEIDFRQTYTEYITTVLQATQTVEITYSATLNENAEIFTLTDNATNDNTTWATYGELKNMETSKVTTTTKTYDFNLYKYYTQDHHTEVALAGAEFKLYTADDDKVVKLIKIDDLNYRVAMSDESGIEIITSIATDDITDVVNVKGLAGDMEYYLKETKAPAGYNLLTETISIGSSSGYPYGATVEVENTQGTLLPSTGGTGTKVLFAVGGVLVVVAFVLFTSKRRMSAEG